MENLLDGNKTSKPGRDSSRKGYDKGGNPHWENAKLCKASWAIQLKIVYRNLRVPKSFQRLSSFYALTINIRYQQSIELHRGRNNCLLLR